MVFGLFKFAQKNPEEEFKEQAKQELEARKSVQAIGEKSEDVKAFLNSKAAAGIVNEFHKKGYTKRGITNLLRTIFPLFKSDKGVVSAAKDILASLKGEDGLSRILGVLKLVPEGIMKGMK